MATDDRTSGPTASSKPPPATPHHAAAELERAASAALVARGERKAAATKVRHASDPSMRAVTPPDPDADTTAKLSLK